MASPNLGTGKGGKSFQDRQLAADVRNTALKQIQEVLKDSKAAKKFSPFKKQMLLKLAPTLLPRLNEHSGNDGDPIKVDIGGPLAKVYGEKPA